MQDLIVGFGYVGKYLSSLLTSKNIEHSIASRTVKSDVAHAINIDLDKPIKPIAAQNIWYFAPPNKDFDTDERLKNFLNTLADTTQRQRIVYISTTGVYGNCDGEWVDESRPVNPQTDRAMRRVDAEQQLMNWSNNGSKQFVILRVAGIYGPDRLPISRLQKNLPMLAEHEAPWSNRIQVEDLASICFEAMYQNTKNEIFNVADNAPSNMAAYFNQVADIVGLPRPPVVSLKNHGGQISAAMLSYLNESRRIDNAKIIERLKIALRYPSLKEGLPAAWAASTKAPEQAT